MISILTPSAAHYNTNQASIPQIALDADNSLIPNTAGDNSNLEALLSSDRRIRTVFLLNQVQQAQETQPQIKSSKDKATL